MEQFTYERPRERLQRTGAGSLTTVELLQVLIASGVPNVSSARISKNVQALFESTQGTPEFNALLRISGLGVAKSCQILAAIEIGTRMSREPPVRIPVADMRVRRAAKPVIVCTYLDGAGVHVGEYYATLGGSPKNTILLKHMFGEALAKRARSIDVVLGSKVQDISNLNTPMLSALRTLFDTASLLQIRLSVYLANKHELKPIKRDAVYG